MGERTSKENELIGTIAQCLLNDMADASNLRVQIAESVGFNKGYERGFDEGYASAQRDMRKAMGGVHVAAGYQFRECQ
jgi:hypothetical protein